MIKSDRLISYYSPKDEFIMKKISLFVTILLATGPMVFGQIDVSELNKPGELLSQANLNIENGNYEQAVQELIAAIRLNPKIREMYLSLNTACSHTNQTVLLKSYLQKAKTIFEEDDEICYYLGNIYQNENNLPKAIQEYTLAIQYSKKNGEDYELVYAYYQNRASCYLKGNEFAKAIPDFNYALKLNQENGAIYANRGIAYYKTGKLTEACQDWRKASKLGVSGASTYLKRYCK